MDPRSQPKPGQPGGRPFIRKLGLYLMGVAIGLMLLGWFQYRKSTAKQAERARDAAVEPVEAGAGGNADAVAGSGAGEPGPGDESAGGD